MYACAESRNEHWYLEIEGKSGMKVKPSVKPRCEKCKIILRKGKVRVICENPNHKQIQG